MTTPDVGDARRRLVEAHAKRASAQQAIDNARAAVVAARALVAETRDELDSHIEASKAISNNRSDGIVRAIRAGLQPSFDPALPLSEAASLRVEAEARLEAAATAFAELEADERGALSRVAAASESVRAGVESVVIAQADAMAREIEEHEDKALKLRAELGGSLSPVGQVKTMTDALKRVISSTDDLGDVFLRRGDLWTASRRAADIWREHLDRLSGDPDHELSFDEPSPDAEAQRAA